MPGCTNGAELVKKLAATGTGEPKLAGARKFLAAVWGAERRVATAAAVLAVLETGCYEVGAETVTGAPAPEGTLAKAREIVRSGEWRGPVAEVAVPVEEQLLAEGGPPDELDLAPKRVEPKPAEKPAEADEGAKAPPADEPPKPAPAVGTRPVPKPAPKVPAPAPAEKPAAPKG